MIKNRYLRDVVAESGRCEITTDMIKKAEQLKLDAWIKRDSEWVDYLKRIGAQENRQWGPLGMGSATGLFPGGMLGGLFGSYSRCPHCGR